MRQCNNCKEWIPREYQYCPVCGERQANRQTKNKASSSGKGSGCFIFAIVMILLSIIGGTLFYMYYRGVFDQYLTDDCDTTMVWNDTTVLDQELPSQLSLTSATFRNNQMVSIELKISSSGEVSGKFMEHESNNSFNITGFADKATGEIKVENTQQDLKLTLTPLGGDGNYDCHWYYKGTEDYAYFYKPEKEPITESTQIDTPTILIDTVKASTLIESRDTTPTIADTAIIEQKGAAEAKKQIRQLKLSGTLGEHIKIKMNLFDIENGNGEYYYVSQGPTRILTLKCKTDGNGNVTMTERDSKGKVTGVFKGRLENGKFNGTFTNSKGKQFPVSLHHD